MATSVRVVRVECGEFTTTFTAPGHGFPPGAQVRVEGYDALSAEVFFVGFLPDRDTFSIDRNVCVDVASIDTASAMVHTKTPHQIPNTHKSVFLHGFDNDLQAPVGVHYMVGEIVDEYSLRLESYCEVKRASIPAKLCGNLVNGRISRKHCEVIVPQSQCTGSGLAFLVCQLPKSQEACLQDWQAAIRAARQKYILKDLPRVQQPVLPDARTLHVAHCGWSYCAGVYSYSGHMHYSLGPLVSMLYSEELGMWCLLADVVAVYSLERQRSYLGLKDWDGPQLLYVRQDPNPAGRWEPVIGPGPGPSIRAHNELAVLQTVSMQPSLLLHPSVGSGVLDLLFNFTAADWRGGLQGHVWGFSAMEAIHLALSLWRGLCACSAVCHSWQASLKPFHNLVQICDHALQIPHDLRVSEVALPTIREAIRAIMFHGRMWRHGLSVTRFKLFQERRWPAQVVDVELSSELDAASASIGTLFLWRIVAPASLAHAQ